MRMGTFENVEKNSHRISMCPFLLFYFSLSVGSNPLNPLVKSKDSLAQQECQQHDDEKKNEKKKNSHTHLRP